MKGVLFCFLLDLSLVAANVVFADVLLPFADAANELFKIVLKLFIRQAVGTFYAVNDFSFFSSCSYGNEDCVFAQFPFPRCSLFVCSEFKTFDIISR